MSETGRLGREAAWLAVGQALAALAGLVGVRVLTEITTPEVYGLSWLFINGSWLATLVLARPVSQMLSRFYYDAARDPERLDRLMALVWRLQLGTALVVGVVYVAIVAALGALKAEQWMAFAILPVYFFFFSFFSTAEIFLNTARRRGSRVLLTVAEAVLKPACAITLCLLWKPDVNAFVLGYTGSGILTGAVGLAVLRSIGRRPPLSLPRPTREEVREGLAYLLPWVGFAACAWILSLSDRYLIAGLAGVAWTGTYVAAYQVGAAPFQFLGSVFGSLVQPVIFQDAAAAESDGARSLSSAVRAFAWIGLPILAGFILLRGWLMRLLVAPEYWGGLDAVLWIGVAVFLVQLGDLVRNAFLIAKRPGSVLIINIVAAMLNIVLNLLLIPELGIAGAAVAACIAYSVYVVWSIAWGRMLVRWTFPVTGVVKAGIMSAAAGGAGFLVHRQAFQGEYDWVAGAGVAGAFGAVLAIGLILLRRDVMSSLGRGAN